MREKIPENLLKLADALADPLYVVGGSVRDFLCGFPLPPDADWDLASPCDEETLLGAAIACGFSVCAVYRNTGTVKLKDENGIGYEFTRFRSDKYVRGLHVPSEITFTHEIERDATRRDFCANAVYYEIKNGTFADPLGGIGDIEKKLLRTVAPSDKVFGEDGLRLMRLSRLAAQTGFSPDARCLAGATRNAPLIRDIAAERIFTEMRLLLASDEKHGFPRAAYRGLQILKKTGVLKEILPELALGDGMAQRSDFHAHDVLEHSLRCVAYAPPQIRLAALLHDVGKPFCYLRDGNFHAHAEEGARIAREILTRWKAPVKCTEEVCALVLLHMRDYNLQMRESKVRQELIGAYPLSDKLFALKQADFSACKDDLSPAPSVTKWQTILKKMQEEGVPFTSKELAVNGKELQEAGIPARETGAALKELLCYCAQDGRRNRKEHLLRHAVRIFSTEENI